MRSVIRRSVFIVLIIGLATGTGLVRAADPPIPEGINREDLSPEQLRELKIREAQRLLEQMKQNKQKQEQEAEPKPAAEQRAVAGEGVQAVQLDLQTLLGAANNRRGASDDVKDPIWKFEMPPGQRLMLVPLTPLAVEQPVDLDMNKTLKIIGARQLAWYLPEDSNARGGRGSSRAGELQINPPLLATDVTLRPGNIIHYGLARKLNYAEIDARNEAYAVLLDRNQLERPEPPQNRGSNVDNRQRLEAMVKYRQELDNYNRQITFVQQLPTEFTKPAPAVIYGVFAMPVLGREIEFGGLEGEPWKVPLDLLQRLQEFGNGRGNHFEVDQALTELLKIEHVYSQRSAAIILSSGNMLSSMPDNSPLIGKIQTLLQSKDRATRMRLVSALATSKSSVPIVADLLAKAMSDPDPTVGLIAMQARAGEASRQGAMTPAQIQALAAGAQRLLVQAADQPVQEVLAVPLEAAGKDPELVAAFSQKIDLTQAPAGRRAAMVDLVVERANQGQMLPMVWLSDQLLGGGDQDLQQRALSKMLEMAEPEPVSDLRGRGRERQRGPAFRKFELYSARHGLFACLSSASDSVRAMAWKALDLFEMSRAGVGRADDPLKRSEPEAMYDALAAAAMTVEPTPMSAVRFMEKNVREPAVAAAMRRIMFEGQGPARLAAMRLILPNSGNAIGEWLARMTADERLIAARIWYERYPEPEGDIPTTLSARAAETPVAPKTAGGIFGLLKAAVVAGGDQDQDANAPADQPANAPAPEAPTQANAAPLTPDLRAPLSVGLLRITVAEVQSRPPVFDWFGEQIVKNQRPAPRQWAVAFGNREALMMGMASPDEAYGLACCEAMISTVVAPTPGAAEQLRAAAVQHAGAIADPVQQAEQLATIWQTVQQQLGEQLSQQVPGKYKMTLKVYERSASDGAAAKFTPYDLGEVLINLDGGAIALGPDPLDAQLVPAPFAIRLTAPGQLLDIAAKKGSELKLSFPVGSTIDLEPDGAGNYRSEASTRGQQIEVELIRQP